MSSVQTSQEPLPGRTIAIGDIHGCARALEVILEAIEPNPDDVIITLGDYIDRGPQSRQVIDRLLRLQQECQLIPLRGNHECLLLDALQRKTLFNFWLQCGGQQTLDSYGGTIEQIPPSHIDFFQRCRPFHETEHHLFFHASFDPTLPAGQQDDQQLFWEHLRGPGPGQHASGKRVFVGHTPQDGGRILRLDHVVCLDTYCFGNGCLSAMEVHSETTWQANQQGITCLWPTQD